MKGRDHEKYFNFTADIFSAFPAAAQNPDKNIEQQYKDAGIKDAEILQKVYDKLHKPLYQQAYDDYLQDLDYIAEHGVAPDNEALYRDLLARNSDEKFIYSQTEADRHQFFNVYQNFN